MNISKSKGELLASRLIIGSFFFVTGTFKRLFIALSIPSVPISPPPPPAWGICQKTSDEGGAFEEAVDIIPFFDIIFHNK